MLHIPEGSIVVVLERVMRFVSANSLRRARLADNRAGTTFRRRELRAHVIHTRSLAGNDLDRHSG